MTGRWSPGFSRSIVLALALPAALAGTSATADENPFATLVAPIFERRCVSCHQPPDPKGGLSLVSATELSAGGESGQSIVPGKPNESLLVEYISGDEPQMPKNGQPLSAAEVAAVRDWIAAGTNWPDGVRLVDRRFEDRSWWSLQLLAGRDPPAIESDWIKTPIDAFILSKLTRHGLTPNPEADRRTLIRRLSFDLHGLPPTPDEVAAFLNDARDDAYELLVDRLLDSPRYGERWGRHWLDVVHYGDTHGYDKDKRRDNAWPYRDYVIAALNADKPYGRFIEEQLAGDVLYPTDPSATVATGFVAAGPWDFVGHVELREGTVDKEITRLLDRDDMLMNAMSTFVSLTTHCARCHDHPFDPIPQTDYYRLQAVFAGVDRGDRPYQDQAVSEEFRIADLRRQEMASRRIELVQAKLAVTSPELADLARQIARQKAARDALPNPFDTSAQPVTSPTNGYHSQIADRPDIEKWVQVDLGSALPIDVVRLVPARPTDFPDTPGFGFPVRFQVAVSDNPEFSEPVVIADYSNGDYPNPLDVPVAFHREGVTGRYVRLTAQRLWPRTGDFCLALAELQVESGGANIAAGAAVTALDTIDAGRWHTANVVDGFNSRQPIPVVSAPESASVLEDRERAAEALVGLESNRTQLADSLVDPAVHAELAAVAAELAQVEDRLKTLSAGPLVYALKSIPPREIHRLHRGDVKNPQEPVEPGAVSCVPGLTYEFALSNPASEGERRAVLARWIADPANPLTWRSIVNRVWHYHFDRGLVDTPNDFGRMGSRPTHPELLDWMAADFRDGGQSLKRLHKLIVTSAVYRQSSANVEAHATIDSGNRWLWRMNRRRLDAESLRDSLLAVSGSLDETMGGPGYDLFGFKDDHSPHYLYDEHNVDDPRSHRRAVYRFVVRSVPDPFMECLDSADPSQNVPARTETITPLQALALLNNPFVVRQAERMAARVEGMSSDPSEHIAAAYRLTLARDPTGEESRLLVDYAANHGLANTCRVILNANEFLFVD